MALPAHLEALCSLIFTYTLNLVSLCLQKGNLPLDSGTWFQGVDSLPSRDHVSCVLFINCTSLALVRERTSWAPSCLPELMPGSSVAALCVRCNLDSFMCLLVTLRFLFSQDTEKMPFFGFGLFFDFFF